MVQERRNGGGRAGECQDFLIGHILTDVPLPEKEVRGELLNEARASCEPAAVTGLDLG